MDRRAASAATLRPERPARAGLGRALPGLALWSLASLLLAGPALADPCALAAPGPLAPLQARLATAGAAEWPAIASEAAAAAAAARDPAERACAHYLAGSAAFFLSRPADARAERAWQAVRHLIAAQALAPAGLAEPRAASRLATAWQRVPGAPGWPADRPPRAVTLDSDGAPLRLWAPGLEAPLALALPAGRHTLSLRPGPWELERVDDRCSPGRVPVQLAAAPVATPGPACPVQLELVDAEGPVGDARVSDPAGAPISAPRGGRPLRISAPGYRDHTLTPPPEGGPLRVTLERCPVTLVLTVTPAAVPVAGDGPAPWGPRTVTLWPDSPRPAPVRVDVPRPASCQDARHPHTLQAPHPVVARAPGGPLSQLIVGDKAHDPEGFFLNPGVHIYQASRPGAPPIVGQLTVPPCARPEGCEPLELRAAAPPPPDARAPLGARISLGIGGALTGAGLVAGALALTTQGELDRYRSPAESGLRLDPLIDRRDDQALAADILLGVGLTSLAIGLAWSLLYR